jgi:hypothetical protein
MKYLKMISLAALAAMALTAFASSASATVLTSGSETLGIGTKIEASLKSGGSSYLKTTGGSTLNTCTSGSVSGSITNAGGSSATVVGSVPKTGLVFSNCISTVHTESGGTLEIHNITGTTNGTVTASGFVLNNTIFSTTCLYESGTGKHLGTLVGGTPATLSINITVKESQLEPKPICPDEAVWTADYTVTNPSNLVVH